MWNWLIKFCGGRTDINENNIPDNEELLHMVELIVKKLEEVKSKK